MHIPMTTTYDRWKTTDPSCEDGDPCPDCEAEGREGWLDGDGRWEWWCTNEECNYGGDAFP